MRIAAVVVLGACAVPDGLHQEDEDGDGIENSVDPCPTQNHRTELCTDRRESIAFAAFFDDPETDPESWMPTTEWAFREGHVEQLVTPATLTLRTNMMGRRIEVGFVWRSSDAEFPALSLFSSGAACTLIDEDRERTGADLFVVTSEPGRAVSVETPNGSGTLSMEGGVDRVSCRFLGGAVHSLYDMPWTGDLAIVSDGEVRLRYVIFWK
jgi:hypothetical protein